MKHKGWWLHEYILQLSVIVLYAIGGKLNRFCQQARLKEKGFDRATGRANAP